MKVCLALPVSSRSERVAPGGVPGLIGSLRVVLGLSRLLVLSTATERSPTNSARSKTTLDPQPTAIPNQQHTIPNPERSPTNTAPGDLPSRGSGRSREGALQRLKRNRAGLGRLNVLY